MYGIPVVAPRRSYTVCHPQCVFARPRISLHSSDGAWMLSLPPSSKSACSPCTWCSMQNGGGCAELYAACGSGQVAEVEVLLGLGVDANWRNEVRRGRRAQGRSPSLLCGHMAPTDPTLASPVLMKAGGATPLHEAARMWRPEVLRLLLQHGGNAKAWEHQTKVGH